MTSIDLPNLTRIQQATIVRIARRLREGYTGEIVILAQDGGVKAIRWIQTETGDSIKEELG